MLYAVVARPQVLRRQGHELRRRRSAQGRRASCESCRSTPTPGAPQFNPLGGVAVIARNTWAAMQGRNALKIVWDDGPNASYDSVAYKATLEEAARKPGKVVRDDGDFTTAAACCREAHHGGILPSASRARVDGTARGERSHHARQVRSLGLLPVAPGRARPGRQTARHARSKMSPCTSPCSAADSDASPSPITASRRPCCPRRWTASRSRSSGRATTICTTTISTPYPSSIWKPASMPRDCRWRGCIAASRRRSCRRSTRTPSRRRTGNSAWASSTCPSPFPTSASRIRKRSRTRGSAGSVRYRIFPTHSPCSHSSPSWPRRRGATRRTFCSR